MLSVDLTGGHSHMGAHLKSVSLTLDLALVERNRRAGCFNVADLSFPHYWFISLCRCRSFYELC